MPKQVVVICAGAPNPYLDYLKTVTYDYLIGVDAGASRLLAAGYIPDLAVGDFDSAHEPDGISEKIVLPAAKDDTDLEHALSVLNADDIAQVVILGALGNGRLDHLLCNMWLVHQPRFEWLIGKCLFVEQNNTLAYFNAGQYTIQKDTQKKYVSFIGMTPIEQLSLSGVVYPLDKRDYAYPMALISNEFLPDTDVLCLSFAKGVICMVESCDS